MNHTYRYCLYKDPAAVRKGSGKPLPWPFGPHVAAYK